jgi:hypothetical protein
VPGQVFKSPLVAFWPTRMRQIYLETELNTGIGSLLNQKGKRSNETLKSSLCFICYNMHYTIDRASEVHEA